MEQGVTLIPEHRLSPCVCEAAQGKGWMHTEHHLQRAAAKITFLQRREALQGKLAALYIHLYLGVW